MRIFHRESYQERDSFVSFKIDTILWVVFTDDPPVFPEAIIDSSRCYTNGTNYWRCARSEPFVSIQFYIYLVGKRSMTNYMFHLILHLRSRMASNIQNE